jgi:hypothetical protein
VRPPPRKKRNALNVEAAPNRAFTALPAPLGAHTSIAGGSHNAPVARVAKVIETPKLDNAETTDRRMLERLRSYIE